jgi:S-adenosylmethionine:tRNA ribosyltransferase-isomerase
MQLADFDYSLPPELVAVEPAARRDAARLLTLRRTGGALGETVMADLPALLQPGDLLVVNDTRVIPARLFGSKESGGRVELFLVRRLPGSDEEWTCLIRAAKPCRPGTRLFLPEGMVATILAMQEEATWRVAFEPREDFDGWLDRYGSMPLPPYLKRPATAADRERYQTVFARERGAVAAPTAALHFTPELLAAIAARGVPVATVTLHVGLGTFLPVRVDNILEHRMHRERYRIPAETARAVADCRARGGRVVAVGTTVARTLEQAGRDDGAVEPGAGEADIFIYPGYRFKVVDALLTNFHLPKSTLLMLVAAFAGREQVLRAYDEAIARRFRFYSYGDAMLIY